MSINNGAGAGVSNAGAWSSGAVYNPGQCVTNAGAAYLCYSPVAAPIPISQQLADQQNVAISTTHATNDTATGTGAGAPIGVGNDGQTTGKWYFEFVSSNEGNNSAVGIALVSAPGTTQMKAAAVGGGSNTFSGGAAPGNFWSASNWTKGMNFAVDLGAKLYWIRCPTQSANWNNSGTANPATGVGGFALGTVPGAVAPFMTDSNTGSTLKSTLITDPRFFTGSLPSGFSPWSTPGANTAPGSDAAHWV